MSDKMWDEVVAGPQPSHGLGKLRKVSTARDVEEGSSIQPQSLSMPSSPTTPGTPTSTSPRARKDNVWRSVFNPGSNSALRDVGSNRFDKPNQPGSPTVYDWMYSGDSRSKYR